MRSGGRLLERRGELIAHPDNVGVEQVPDRSGKAGSKSSARAECHATPANRPANSPAGAPHNEPPRRPTPPSVRDVGVPHRVPSGRPSGGSGLGSDPRSSRESNLAHKDKTGTCPQRSRTHVLEYSIGFQASGGRVVRFSTIGATAKTRPARSRYGRSVLGSLGDTNQASRLLMRFSPWSRKSVTALLMR